MVLSRTSGPKFSGMGFTLVEVLVVLLLCTVPVVAAQRLMFCAADSVRFTTQQALAERAATNTLNRIYAFHVVGLWPQGSVAAGQWLDALNTNIASDDLAQSTLSCMNRWCSVDQWAAHEAGALGCALKGDWAAGLCANIAQTPTDIQDRVERPQVPRFQASLAANRSLGVQVRWPKAQALHQPTEPGNWHQITLGDHP